MKKALFAFFVLFMFGCGAGGGGTSVSSSGSGGSGSNPNTPSGPVGYITLTIGGGAGGAALRTLATASSARVVVRMIESSVDDFGNPVNVTTYSQIVDFAIPGSSTISVPPGTGYTVDVLTYTTAASGIHTLVKYGGTTGINVTSGTTTSASITLAELPATISAPASANAGAIYTVSIANLGFPLSTGLSNLRVSTTPITDTFAYSSTYSSFGLVAPALTVADPAQTLYFQALFSIDRGLIKQGESTTNWVYYYPNSANADTPVSMTVQPPGGVSIIVN